MNHESSAARRAAIHSDRLPEDEQVNAAERAARSMELPQDEELDSWSGEGEQHEFVFKDLRQLELFGLPDGATAREVESGVALVEGARGGKEVSMEVSTNMLAKAERSVALFDVAEAATKAYFAEGDARDTVARQALEMLVRYVASKEPNVDAGKNYVMEAARKMSGMESVTEILKFSKDLAMKGWVEHNVRPGETGKRGATGELNQSLLELGYEPEDVQDLGDEIGGNVDDFLKADKPPSRLAGLKKLLGSGMEIVKQLKSESAELIASAGKKAYLKGMEMAGSLVALAADAAVGKQLKKDLAFDINFKLFGTESTPDDIDALEAELLAAMEGEDPTEQEMAEMEVEAAEMGPEPTDAEMEDIKALRTKIEAEEARKAKENDVAVRPGHGSRRTSRPASPYSVGMGDVQARARHNEQARVAESGADYSLKQKAEMSRDQAVHERYARFDAFMKDIDNLDIVKGNPELMDLLKMSPEDRLLDRAVIRNTGFFGKLGGKYRAAKKRAAEFDSLMALYEQQASSGKGIGTRSPLGIRKMPSGEVVRPFEVGGMPQERRGAESRRSFEDPTVSPEKAAEYYKNLQELQEFIKKDIQENPRFYGSEIGKDLIGILAMTGQETVEASSKSDKEALQKQMNLLGMAQRRREMVENPEKFSAIRAKFEVLQDGLQEALEQDPTNVELSEGAPLLDLSPDDYLMAQVDDRRRSQVQRWNRLIQKMQMRVKTAADFPEPEAMERGENREAA